MALGCSDATSGLGSHVRNENTLPHSEGRQMPAKAATSLAGSVNHQHAGFPPSSLPGFGSAKDVYGTRHRHSGFAIVERQKLLSRLRTFVIGLGASIRPLVPRMASGIPQGM